MNKYKLGDETGYKSNNGEQLCIGDYVRIVGCNVSNSESHDGFIKENLQGQPALTKNHYSENGLPKIIACFESLKQILEEKVLDRKHYDAIKIELIQKFK